MFVGLELGHGLKALGEGIKDLGPAVRDRGRTRAFLEPFQALFAVRAALNEEKRYAMTRREGARVTAHGDGAKGCVEDERALRIERFCAAPKDFLVHVFGETRVVCAMPRWV